MSNRNARSRATVTTTVKPPIRRKWTPEEDELLREGLKEFGVGNWAIIRNKMNLDRTGQQIKDRWRNLNKGGLLLAVCWEEPFFIKEAKENKLVFHSSVG